MNNTRLVFLAAMLAVASRASAAQEPQPSLDELLNLKPVPSRSTPPPTEPSTPRAQGEGKGVPVDPEVARRLTGAQAADLLRSALAQMHDASERLGKAMDPGLPTQRVQEDVLAKLDRVIAASEHSSSGKSGTGSPGSAQPRDPGGAGAGQKPGSTQGPSSVGGGAPVVTSAGGKANRPMTEIKNEWGSLPPRLRDELRQGQDERFSPVYREMTERYYRSLAEEGK